MTSDIAIELCRSASFLTLTVAGPALIGAFVTALIVGVIQALTQLQDSSITFVPKLIVITLVLLFLLPWGLDLVIDYAREVIQDAGRLT
ncbi:MAG: EscS/YscS/HrcS family type III secretion system export apparatus protein [Planctomycetes bacterium]|nr:EscS/YscS/HrcS family type III secretion system export apparatus protein [Planctomycetota bacterium]